MPTRGRSRNNWSYPLGGQKQEQYHEMFGQQRRNERNRNWNKNMTGRNNAYYQHETFSYDTHKYDGQSYDNEDYGTYESDNINYHKPMTRKSGTVASAKKPNASKQSHWIVAGNHSHKDEYELEKENNQVKKNQRYQSVRGGKYVPKKMED